MNRAGDAEFLLHDVVASDSSKEDHPFKRGFIFGLSMILGLWLGAMIAGGLTIILMILAGTVIS